MSNTIILFGSKYRSTAKIVGKMRGHLESKNIVVDTMTALPGPIDLKKYSLVIIGSGIYGGDPHKNVQDFINSNHAMLNRTNVATFAVCGLIQSKNVAVRSASQRYADRMAWGFSPAAKAVFAGRIPDLGWLLNRIRYRFMVGVKPGDYRDWNAIMKWTDSLTKLL